MSLSVALERVWLTYALKKWQLLIKHPWCLCIFQTASQTPSFIFSSSCCQLCSSTFFQSHKAIWVTSIYLRLLAQCITVCKVSSCPVWSCRLSLSLPVWFASPLVRSRYSLRFPSASPPPSGSRSSGRAETFSWELPPNLLASGWACNFL